MNKSDRLKKIRAKLAASAKKLPLAKIAKDTVPGEGNPNADILFIGEAAGYNEHVQRRPFVGRAGKLLNSVLEDIGIPRKDVYITNILKVRPPQNRDPLPNEIEAYRPFLDEEIEVIKPKIIATLGRFSMGKFLPDAKISQVHGQPRWVDFNHQRLLIMPMYHPAAALRNGNVLAMFKADFDKLPRVLNMVLNPPGNNSASIEPQAPKEREEKPAENTDQQLSLI
jgi:DNA polymerase